MQNTQNAPTLDITTNLLPDEIDNVLDNLDSCDEILIISTDQRIIEVAHIMNDDDICAYFLTVYRASDRILYELREHMKRENISSMTSFADKSDAIECAMKIAEIDTRNNPI